MILIKIEVEHTPVFYKLTKSKCETCQNTVTWMSSGMTEPGVLVPNTTTQCPLLGTTMCDVKGMRSECDSKKNCMLHFPFTN